MNAKHLIIFGLIFVIFTIGAVSASENMTSDEVSGIDDEICLEEASQDSVLEGSVEDDFFAECADSVGVDDDGMVLYVDSEDDYKGNLTVTVGENTTPVYNKEFSDRCAELTLNDLEITQPGLYRILVNLVSAGGSKLTLLDTKMLVSEPVDEIHMDVNNEIILGTEDSPDKFIELKEHPKGNLLIYIGSDLYYNKTVTDGDIYFKDLNREVPYGESILQIKLDNGKKVRLVYAGFLSVDYFFDVGVDILNYLETGDDLFYEISFGLPYDAKGTLYVTFNGKKTKVPYKGGKAVFEIDTSVLKLGKEYTFTAEFTGDAKYPAKKYEKTLMAIPQVLTPLETMAVGEKQYLFMKTLSSCSGTLKLYKSKLVENEWGVMEYVKDDSKLISTANVVKGQAKIPVTLSSEGEFTFFYEYVSGKYSYDGNFTVTAFENFNKFSISISSDTVEVGKIPVITIKKSKSYDSIGHIYIDGILDSEYELDYDVTIKKIALSFFKELDAGKHYITVCGCANGWSALYDAHDYSVTFDITVKPKPVVKLTLAKVKVKKSSKKLVIKATLKINGKPVKGKKVKFKFNKKSYTAKTDKKGVAKITVTKKILKKLKVGKKVTYRATYGKKTVKRTVRVKK